MHDSLTYLLLGLALWRTGRDLYRWWKVRHARCFICGEPARGVELSSAKWPGHATIYFDIEHSEQAIRFAREAARING